MLDAIKHIKDDIFFLSGRQRIGAHALCMQHINCCSSLDFLFLKPCPPNSPSWIHWLQDY